MKKAFDQTVRDIKRGVNKKVLKVPSIEQKVLEATSNESWGPHGSLLADIAMASRNYHEYHMIMSVIWKRINDTGKNWRHVYKGLTVLEYLVANGSERVIDEIREHAYQITSLSEFQYLDHTGRDQGNNVRKKSQSLVALVNDKERIQEVRQKAAANWDKFHNTSGGARYRPGSYPGAGGYDDDRNGDRYGDERYGRDRYRDDEYRGRRSIDGDNYGQRSRSSDRDREHAYEDEGQYSSRHVEQKSSEQNVVGPPSYEDAVSGGRSPVSNERDGETKSGSPPVTTSHETTVSSTPVAPAVASPSVAATPPPPPPANEENNGFDEFDPRGSFPAAPPTSGGAETDLFGSASDPFSLNELALVPVTTATSEAQTFAAASSAPGGSSQPFDDPFGDGPFRAAPSTSDFGQSVELPKAVSDSGNNFGFGGSFDQTTDILADLLPPSAPSQTGSQTQSGQLPSQTSFPSQTGFSDQPNPPSFPGQTGQSTFQGGQPTPLQDTEPVSQPGFSTHGGQAAPLSGFSSQMGSVPQPGFPGNNGQSAYTSNFYGGFEPQGSSAPLAAQSNTSSFYQPPQVQSGSTLTASTGALAIVPQQPSKFETKSTVWADTLNRGLVNLNIAGSKTNPLSDIGVDFEALNRKEKRMEKGSANPVTSNVAMGKAMGSGSGIGRAGAGVFRPQPNPMMGSSMVGPGAAPVYGTGYGGVNQPMGQYPPGPGTYNPMMGRGAGYGQLPYGGFYR